MTRWSRSDDDERVENMEYDLLPLQLTTVSSLT